MNLMLMVDAIFCHPRADSLFIGRIAISPASPCPWISSGCSNHIHPLLALPSFCILRHLPPASRRILCGPCRICPGETIFIILGAPVFFPCSRNIPPSLRVSRGRVSFLHGHQISRRKLRQPHVPVRSKNMMIHCAPELFCGCSPDRIEILPSCLVYSLDFARNSFPGALIVTCNAFHPQSHCLCDAHVFCRVPVVYPSVPCLIP